MGYDLKGLWSQGALVPGGGLVQERGLVPEVDYGQGGMALPPCERNARHM